MNYDVAFTRLLGHEGKLSMDPEDRGNWTSGIVGQGELKGTKWGISAMSYPKIDIANLTKEEAYAIYYRDFWKPVGGDSLHSATAFQLFDGAVNHGISTSIRLFQRAVGAADDGVFGPATKAAADAVGVDDSLKLYNAERLDFYTRISTWPRHGKGWARRIVNNLKYAADDFDAPWNEHLEVVT